MVTTTADLISGASTTTAPFACLLTAIANSDEYVQTGLDEESYMAIRCIRVIEAALGAIVRMSAPELDIVVEGSNTEKARHAFYQEIAKRPDAACLAFDVGPTRTEEIARGLDAPEDEDWSGLMSDSDD